MLYGVQCSSTNPGYLLLHHLGLSLEEERQQHEGEVVGVRVGVSQLIGHCVQEQVAPLRVYLSHQPAQQREVRGLLHALGGDGRPRLLQSQDAGLSDAQDECVQERNVVAVRKGSSALEYLSVTESHSLYSVYTDS